MFDFPRKRLTMPSLLVASLVLQALPAEAATFPDVPPDHWAARAVDDLTSLHVMLTPMDDGLFHGDKPFTRFQFADTLQRLILELETQARCSLAGNGEGGYRFTDIPETHLRRRAILDLANGYHLFQSVPGLDPDQFHGDQVVSRYEMAVVIDNLMRQAESRDVVRIDAKPARPLPFTDVPPDQWARSMIDSVWGRYGVVAGFPDHTFRGTEELTRYQFAAAAQHTVPLIRELVAKTAAAKDLETKPPVAAPPSNVLVDGRLLVGLNTGTTFGIGLDSRQDLGEWWISERLRVLPASPGNAGFLGGLGVSGGYTWRPAADWQIRPGIGLGGWGAASQPNVVLAGGLDVGVDWRINPGWALSGLAAVHQSFFQNGGTGGLPLLPAGHLLVNYFPVPHLALRAGVEAWGIPNAASPAVIGPVIGMSGQF